MKRPAYFMPGEWEKHAATWLSWPRHPQNWEGPGLRQIENQFLEIIRLITSAESVHLLVRDLKEETFIRARFIKAGIHPSAVFFHYRPARDIWIRDYGPLFLKSGRKKMALKWCFNAWGKKYRDLQKDNEVFGYGSGLIPCACREVPMVLEGGSIDVNGNGLCLTTEQCLLNSNRNPGLSKRRIEKNLKTQLGVHTVIWLAGGIQGDDTDGHVDDVARFTDRRTIAAAFEEDSKDANYEILSENWSRLLFFKKKISGIRLVKIPMPGDIRFEGKRLPASYLNFYIANAGVLLPVFETVRDRSAERIFKTLFPQKKIFPLAARDLVYGCGALHCMTQQEPL